MLNFCLRIWPPSLLKGGKKSHTICRALQYPTWSHRRRSLFRDGHYGYNSAWLEIQCKNFRVTCGVMQSCSYSHTAHILISGDISIYKLQSASCPLVYHVNEFGHICEFQTLDATLGGTKLKSEIEKLKWLKRLWRLLISVLLWETVIHDYLFCNNLGYSWLYLHFHPYYIW